MDSAGVLVVVVHRIHRQLLQVDSNNHIWSTPIYACHSVRTSVQPTALPWLHLLLPPLLSLAWV